ncbi:MAG: hypothetical protein LBF91_07535, partial [Azoarcus sp.]|nr:hypothetical protein [Azoarcus sp.]
LALQRVGDDQYASKGDVIFELFPRDRPASIEARFPASKFADVGPGRHVSIRIAGEAESRGGRIVGSRLMDGDSLSGDLRVRIQPDEPLDGALVGRVAGVSVARMHIPWGEEGER